MPRRLRRRDASKHSEDYIGCTTYKLIEPSHLYAPTEMTVLMLIKLLGGFAIWHACPQQFYRAACHISETLTNASSSGFES